MEPSKPSILVTDDSRVVRKAASSTLSETYTVLEASSGDEALSILRKNSAIQALFLDLWMPGMDGYQVLRDIRNSDQHHLRDLPVIVITGDTENEAHRDRALAEGASDFIGKPFSSSQLQNSLSSLLANQHAKADGNQPSSMAETTEIKTASAQANTNTSRLDQLVSGGNALMTRCFEQKQTLSLLKLRIERVGALYHKTGEEFARQVLRDIGLKIMHETRRKDMLVRLTVTDFVVVMPSTNALEANEVSKRILRAVRHHVIEFEDSRFHLSMSGGIATPKLSGQFDFESALETANARMEQAQAAGGNQNIASDAKPSALDQDAEISLDSATDDLKKGDTISVQSNLKTLLRKTFPLLVFVNARLGLDIDDALKKIHGSIKVE